MPFRILVMVSAILGTLFLAAPLVVLIPSSLTAGEVLSFPPKGLSLQWFPRTFIDEGYFGPFMLSLRIAAVSMVVSTVVGTLVAIQLAARRRDGHGSRLWESYFQLPIILPQIALGVALLILFAGLERSMGMSIRGTFYGFVIVHVAVTLPYVVGVVSAGLVNVDRSIEQASNDLGATDWQTIIFVVLPMVRPSIISGAVLAFLNSFDELVISMFLTTPTFVTLPVKLLQQVAYRNDPTIAVVGTVLILGSVLVFGAMNYFLKTNIFASYK